jgi:hypothetical protein
MAGFLLTLQGGRERQYWADAATQGQLRRSDALALSSGIFLNVLDACYKGEDVGLRMSSRVSVAAACLLQLSQLVWLILRPQSYMRHRVTTNFFQRLRWKAFTFVVLGTLVTAEDTSNASGIIPFQRPPSRGTLGAFLTVAFSVPM